MRIFVNGTKHDLPPGSVLTYAAVFVLAYPGRRIAPGASITYHWPGAGDVIRSGTIHQVGGRAEPAEGMRVTCVFTGSA